MIIMLEYLVSYSFGIITIVINTLYSICFSKVNYIDILEMQIGISWLREMTFEF